MQYTELDGIPKEVTWCLHGHIRVLKIAMIPLTHTQMLCRKNQVLRLARGRNLRD